VLLPAVHFHRQANKFTQHNPQDRSSNQATHLPHRFQMHTYKVRALTSLKYTHFNPHTYCQTVPPKCITPSDTRDLSSNLGCSPLGKASYKFSAGKTGLQKTVARGVCKLEREQPLCKHLTNANENTHCDYVYPTKITLGTTGTNQTTNRL